MTLTETEKRTILRLARTSIESNLIGTPPFRIDPEKGAMTEDSGAFVSLHRGGRLRGCIGTFASPNPLYKTVMDMAEAAAQKDPRFPPLAPEELKEIKIEVSVLTPLKEITGPEEIEIGRHGIYLVKGSARGVLLPQVAVEHGFDRYEFLDQTCVKAGLSPGDWKEGAAIFTFEAEIFKEG